MANPQCENGYTKIANEIMDNLIRQKLSGQEFRIALLIIRKTYGYNKKEDSVSLSQMAKALSISSHIRCSQLVNMLQKRKIVTVTENINGIGKKYRFNKNHEEWRPLNGNINPLRKTKATLKEKRKLPLKKNESTKDNITKDNITKDNTYVKDFIAKYCESFKSLYKENPVITSKDAGITKRLIKIPGIETLMKRFFESKDPFIIKNCHSLSIIESQLNKLMVGEQGKFSGIREWLKEKEING